tara:strand:- start:982 stop:1254 length:273 start_codon:yes stop_codon:yes gene_type:complete
LWTHKTRYFRICRCWFAILPNYESLGLAHEASIEIIKLAKNVFKLVKIIAITTPDNDSSIKLLKKLGLIYEKKVTPFEDEEELMLFTKTL